MKKSKLLIYLFSLLIFGVSSNAQTNDILASVNGQNFTINDLDPETRSIFESEKTKTAELRNELLGEQIAQMLFSEEAAIRKTTVEKMLEDEIAKRVKQPTEAQIKEVYDANAAQIGGRSLSEVRSQIVNFLTGQDRQKALFDFVSELKTKHKTVIGKDVNSPALLASDVLATVNRKPVTVQSFNEKAGQPLYELQYAVFSRANNYVENLVYSTMVSAEAKSLGIEPSDLIAREISDKMKDFTDEERDALQTALYAKLSQKYKAKILLKEPAPFMQKIAVDTDDPSKGNLNAPVTVVMFSDFQCSACAATHPVLKKVLEGYGDKVRFVVRDFPLTQIHENAFKAAQAANAANAQGKFFEYSEILYANQNALDTASLKKYAAQINLNQKQFDTDLDSGKFTAEIENDMKDGEKYGINSTPTVYVNGVKVLDLSAYGFRKAIERALNKK